MPEIAGLLAQFLHDLDDSHTRYYPPGLSVTVDYGWRWQMVGEQGYVMSVREDSDAAKKQLQVGDRVLAIDGISLTRQNASLVSYVYHTLSPRAGMRLQLERVDGTSMELVIESSIRHHPPITDYTDLENRRRAREEYERSSRIAHRTRSFDSVLVWKLPRFGYQDETIDRIMRQARDHRWLVLDLRDNPGGAVEAETRLLGHFFPERFVAYAERWRDSTVEQWIEPQRSEPYAGEVLVLLNSRAPPPPRSRPGCCRCVVARPWWETVQPAP